MRYPTARAFLRGRTGLVKRPRYNRVTTLNKLLKAHGFDARLNATKGWRVPRAERKGVKAFLYGHDAKPLMLMVA